MRAQNITIGKAGRILAMLLLTVSIHGGLFAQKSLHHNDELMSHNYSSLINSKSEIINAVFGKNMASNLDEEPLYTELLIISGTHGTAYFRFISIEENFIEEDLGFEDWMLDSFWKDIDVFHEKEMEFESWMLSPF